MMIDYEWLENFGKRNPGFSEGVDEMWADMRLNDRDEEIARLEQIITTLQAQADALAGAMEDLIDDYLTRTSDKIIVCDGCHHVGGPEPIIHHSDCPFAALDAYRKDKEQ